MSASELKQLLAIIEQQLDWGDNSTWQGKDFEILNQLIFDKTKVSLSASTLRRIWGKVEYNHMPSTTTLDTLARFAGFESWRAFTRQKITANAVITKQVEKAPVKPKAKQGRWITVGLIVIAIAAVGLISMHVKKEPAKGTYFFSSKPVTRNIPNSVVFTYDAKAAAGDSVFIQQSWDNRTRAWVDPGKHQYTSVYYYPGFYHAKLLVNKTVVKEHTLLIPTIGWLGLINHEPIPVYLNPAEFLKDGLMSLSVADLKQKNIMLSPQPPMVQYANVGNFTPVPISDFDFSVEVKNDYHEGSGTCQFMNISLVTDNIPVIVPLSIKGCISELNMIDGANMISGKSTDLSGFGTDLTQWVKVNIRSEGSSLAYYVNGKVVFHSRLPLPENIVGMWYMFEGTGSVRNIELKQKNKVIFEAF
ncbi:hypothetical protein ACPPVU_10115 [Mucilaginibacter sp. McL0603]|uniref:hypothetical protein n=1 Tax=Mucilaginibacter sp. McL0603 TaxID=3415670 RepID=UPI003CF951BA